MDEERLPPYDAVLQRPESSEHEKLEYVVIDVEDTGLLEGSGGTIVLHCDISPSRPSMQLYHTFRNLDYATLIALAELTSDMAEETGVVQAEELDKMPTDSGK